MKKIIILCLVALLPLASFAKRQPKPQEVDSLGRKIKTGWNFGILPSIAYDADYGFQGGVLSNVYYYGDGSQYPEYIHSLYVEAAYTTKHHGILSRVTVSRSMQPICRMPCATSTALTATRHATTMTGTTGRRKRQT